MATSILEKIPEEYIFNVEKIRQIYPADYSESMNSVLCQELERFNGLLLVVRETSIRVQRAAAGLEVVDDELERIFDAMYNGDLPQPWLNKSYPSLMPLQGYIKDLRRRILFFREWIDKGIPTLFWLPTFFFTHSFLTGAKQNFSRKNKFAIDEVEFRFQPLKVDDECVDKAPESGVYVYGLFLEGAKWNNAEMILTESDPRVLYTDAPRLWLKPAHRDSKEDTPQGIHYFHAPLYKTSERRGILSTTGHSTNFVMPISLPSKVPAEHWIKRGVALLSQLDNV